MICSTRYHSWISLLAQIKTFSLRYVKFSWCKLHVLVHWQNLLTSYLFVIKFINKDCEKIYTLSLGVLYMACHWGLWSVKGVVHLDISSSLWLGCSSHCTFGFLSRFSRMRSMNFQLEEGKIWSHMTLTTFSARQLDNLSEQTDTSSPENYQWQDSYSSVKR